MPEISESADARTRALAWLKHVPLDGDSADIVATIEAALSAPQLSEDEWESLAELATKRGSDYLPSILSEFWHHLAAKIRARAPAPPERS